MSEGARTRVVFTASALAAVVTNHMPAAGHAAGWIGEGNWATVAVAGRAWVADPRALFDLPSGRS